MTDQGHPSLTSALELDDYEVRNLREGLLFLREVGGDTGDWLGQILNKLPDSVGAPNKPVQEQKRDLAARVGWRGLFSLAGAVLLNGPRSTPLTELRAKAERSLVYPLNRDECLALICTVESARRLFESIRHTRAEAVCDQGPLVDLGNNFAEFFGMEP